MKRILACCIALLLTIFCMACTQTPAAQPSPAPTQAPTEAPKEPTAAAETQLPVEPTEAPAEPTEEPAPHRTVLVVVFSATGTTRGVAQKIAAIEDADLYEIIPAEPYSDADLNWNDRNSRSTKEQDDKNARPAIASEALDLSGYERIYVGYPIWWGEEPRILDTFVESYDFGTITMIPFCTSASSGIGRSGKNLAENAKCGNWLDGKRFSGSVSESDLESWMKGLN